MMGTPVLLQYPRRRPSRGAAAVSCDRGAAMMRMVDIRKDSRVMHGRRGPASAARRLLSSACSLLFLYGPTITILVLSFSRVDGRLHLPDAGLSGALVRPTSSRKQMVGDFLPAPSERSMALGLAAMLDHVIAVLAFLCLRTRFRGSALIF